MLVKTMPLKIMHRQQGMTMVGWLFVLAFLLFQAIMALNIIPVYLTDSSIGSIFSDLVKDAEVRGKDPVAIRKIILKRLRINNIYKLIKKDQIKIKREKGVYVVALAYEPRGKLIGNLDFVVSFSHEARIPKR